jgi:DNA-directed RNA polymerase subunit RPC12/RpoP
MYLKSEYKDIVNKFKGEEKKIVVDLLEKYLRDYAIETISDVNTLKEVIYYEVIQYRLQDKMNDFADNKTIPIQLVNIMHANSDAIIRLKESLGLYKEKEENKFDVLKNLKKRFQVWLGENQGSRTLVCPHCGKMVLLKIKTDAWIAQKHPFFKDRVLYNKHLIKLLNDKKIDRLDVATVLECSPDYVDWILSKIEQQEQMKPIDIVDSKEIDSKIDLKIEVKKIKEEQNEK